LIGLEKWSIAIRGLVEIVNLTNFEEVVDHKSRWASEHGKLSTVAHKFGLINVSSIKLKIELFIEISLDCLGIVKITKAQVVDFVSKIKLVSRHVKSLNGLWVVMT
jgi:hypothetical protein